jgi:hypothetical protein
MVTLPAAQLAAEGTLGVMLLLTFNQVPLGAIPPVAVKPVNRTQTSNPGVVWARMFGNVTVKIGDPAVVAMGLAGRLRAG